MKNRKINNIFLVLFHVLLFLTPPVVKAAHHHAHKINYVPVTQEAHIGSPVFHCPVCDYQIVHFVSHEPVRYHSVLPFVSHIKVTYFQSFILPFAYSFFLRAPPVW
ncbi:MAG TPA: hypothetical protein VE912_08235 [Bacteroidales bacterium]|nr:hypothetical protein [Bacteroidales bacterium]